MIILDTNVLSALMRERPDPAVVTWLDALAPESVWTTAVTVFEIRFGLDIMATGRRRSRLERDFDRLVEEDLDRRILPFDRAAADAAARVAAAARVSGRPIQIQDTQIAGIALARRAALATGNTRHFEYAGIALIDPWQRSYP